MKIDNNYNLVFTGYFSGTVDFDQGIGVANFSSSGNTDIFISKYDSAGNFMWVKQIGNVLDNEPTLITTDSDNNVYIVGSFKDTMDFDPGTGVAALYSANSDAYILKLDSSGNFLWVKQFVSSWSTQFRKIIIDQSGNLILSGNYAGTTDFDPGLNNYLLSSTSGGWNEIIVKLNNSGNLIWAKTITSLNLTFSDMDLDNENSCYVVGSFGGTVDFDPGPGIFNLSTYSGPSKNIVLKLDSNGAFNWAKSYLVASADSFERAYAIVIDKFDIYILQMNNILVQVYYLTKIDTGGSQAWRTEIFEEITNPHMAVDTSHNVYLIGNFVYMNNSGFFSLDPIYGSNFITMANTNGAFIWVKQFGCMSSTATSICWSDVSDLKINNLNEVYTSGYFRDSSDFNPDGAIVNSLYSTNFKTMFIQKLSTCENSFSTISDTACNTYIWNGLTYSASGNYTQTFTNSRGCDSSVTLHLFLKGIAAKAIIISDTLLQALTGGISGISFQWLNCDSGFAIIPGEIDSFYTPPSNGHYAVVFQYIGCIDTSDNCYTISTLQANGIITTEEISISPNPARDKIFIECKIHSLTPYKIEIYNILGERVLITSQHEIDVSTLPKGVYYLKLLNYIKKIVIE